MSAADKAVWGNYDIVYTQRDLSEEQIANFLWSAPATNRVCNFDGMLTEIARRFVSERRHELLCLLLSRTWRTRHHVPLDAAETIDAHVGISTLLVAYGYGHVGPRLGMPDESIERLREIGRSASRVHAALEFLYYCRTCGAYMYTPLSRGMCRVCHQYRPEDVSSGEIDDEIVM